MEKPQEEVSSPKILTRPQDKYVSPLHRRISLGEGLAKPLPFPGSSRTEINTEKCLNDFRFIGANNALHRYCYDKGIQGRLGRIDDNTWEMELFAGDRGKWKFIVDLRDTEKAVKVSDYLKKTFEIFELITQVMES